MAMLTVFSQNRYWIIPPKYVDMYTGEVFDLPNTALTGNPGYIQFIDFVGSPGNPPGSIVQIPYAPITKNDYTHTNSGNTYKSSNGILHDGSVDFILNNRVFETSGKRIVYAQNYNEDLPIIPVPNSCNYYFIISKVEEVSPGLGNYNYKLTYQKSDVQGEDVTTQNLTFNTGALGVSGPVPVFANTRMYLNSSNEPELTLYTLTLGRLHRLLVNESGITYSNYYEIHGTGANAMSYCELEISPNERYVAWVNFNFTFTVFVYDLELNVLRCYRGNSDAPTMANLTGLEFAPESDGVFISFSSLQSGNKLAYMPLSAGEISSQSYGFRHDVLSSDLQFLPDTHTLGDSFLEASVDGLIYASSATGLYGFNPYSPSSGIVKTISINNPPANYLNNAVRYTLPDQADDGNYDNLFQIGCTPEQLYSNNLSSNGTLPVITRVSQTIVAQSNVTVAAGTFVNFKAGEQIVLKPGFNVNLGGNFKATLQPCEDLVVDYCSGAGGRMGEMKLPNLTEVQESFINVFPNTTTGIVNINTGKSIQLLQVEVLMTDGKRILNRKYTGEHEATLDLTQAPTGVYIIQIRHQKGLEVRRIILMR